MEIRHRFTSLNLVHNHWPLALHKMGPKTSYRWAYNCYKWPCRSGISGFVTPLVTWFFGVPSSCIRVESFQNRRDFWEKKPSKPPAFPFVDGGELLATLLCFLREKGRSFFSAGNERRWFFFNCFGPIIFVWQPKKKKKSRENQWGFLEVCFFVKCGAFVPFMELKFPKIETEEMFLVDRRNPANQLSLVIYPRWCRISSINSIAVPQGFWHLLTTTHLAVQRAHQASVKGSSYERVPPLTDDFRRLFNIESLNRFPGRSGL